MRPNPRSRHLTIFGRAGGLGLWVEKRPSALKTLGGEEVGCGQNGASSRLAGTIVSTTTQRARLSEDEAYRRRLPGLSFNLVI